MDIHKVIGKLSRPKRVVVLPCHKYTGPYNPLDEQLAENDQRLPGQEPYNALDAISIRHDVCYRDNEEANETQMRRRDAVRTRRATTSRFSRENRQKVRTIHNKKEETSLYE